MATAKQVVSKAKPKGPVAMAHQAVSLKFMDKHPVVMDMSDPGTGKTFVQIMAFAKRRRKGGGKLLVIAPKSLLNPAWFNDFWKFAPDMTVSVANAENRAKAFEVDADVYVTNTDAVKWVAAELKKNKKFLAGFDTIVVDEITAFKHHTSQRSKALMQIKKYFEYRSGLTGTPNSNSITDVWNPVNFLDDGKRLGHSFYAFRQSTCAPTQVGRKKEMVRWEDKEGAEEVTFSLLADITVRHKADDCLDIPPNNRYTMPYAMPPKQRRAYLEMELTQMAAVAKMTMVTAINAASVRTKLLQIASGAVYEHSDKYHVIDTGRYALTMDLVEERKHSVVFYLWAHQRELLIKEAEARGIKYCVYDGSAPALKRDTMIKDFQNGFYQLFLAHPASAAHGLTLTRATTTIWPSPTDNAEWFIQGNKRIHRNGQKSKTETIVLVSPDSVAEQKVYDRVLVKKGRIDNLLDLFSEV